MFHKAAQTGADIITDFTLGDDVILIDRGMVFADLTISQNGVDAVISWAGNTITLQDVTASDLSQSDFLLS